MLFDKANVKCARILSKYRLALFFRVENNYLTIGACGAERSTLLIFEFSGCAIKAL